ncbi:MAG TPA: cytochrome C oxidase subunit IV family protein [Actinomycetota bacterium]|nr:cytochrome C oxidase subunit IV family protein [Actinomycetota bacterium]
MSAHGSVGAEVAAVGAHGEQRPHPSVGQYVRVAIILGVVTAGEVGLYYLQAIPDGMLIALLVFFSAIKFSLVALWFMHLRFDSRLLRRLFVTGIILAGSVYAIVLATFLLR